MSVEAGKTSAVGSTNGQDKGQEKTPAAEQPDPSKPPAAKVEEAIRALVREEMGKAAAEEKTPAPSGRDAFWLFLCLANIAMLLWWTPEAVLDNPKLEFLFKMIPLVGGYLFALGYLWFRDNLLAAGRSRKFKVSQVLLFAVLLPAGLTQTNVFHLKPLLEPDKAVAVAVIGEDAGVEDLDPKRIWLPLRAHKFKIRFADKDGADKWEERTFTLTPWQMLKAVWTRPRWPLLYRVKLRYMTSDVKVVIKNISGDYDADFLAVLRKKPPDIPVEWPSEEDRRTFIYSCTAVAFGGIGGADSISLPPGTYEMYAKKQGCTQTETKIVNIGLDKPTEMPIDFSSLKCKP